MKMPEVKVRVGVDLVRTNYECGKCDTAYTEQQYSREFTPTCGRCAGPLSKLTLVVARREEAA